MISKALLRAAFIALVITFTFLESYASNRTETGRGGKIYFSADLTGNTYYAIANTAWDVSSTWSLTSGGTPLTTGYPQAGDIVYIGEADAKAVIIPAGFTAECLLLIIGDNNIGTSSSLTLSDATSKLLVNSNLNVNRPGNGNTVALNVGNGEVTVGGNLTLEGLATNNDRIAKVDIDGGRLSISGDLIMVTGNVVTNVIDMSGGAGTLNLGGAFTFTDGLLLAGTSSTFNFNGLTSQTIPIGVSSVVYNNLTINNTSVGGATLGAAITGTNVTGHLTIQSGNFSNGGFSIALATGKNFSLLNEATFNLTGTSTMVSVSGGGTKTFNSTSTTHYSGGAQNVTVEAYGNLTLSGTGNKTFAGATTIAGILTINGNGTAKAALANITTSSAYRLFFDGNQQVAGSWGSTGSTAVNKNNTYFRSTNSGIVNIITSSPEFTTCPENINTPTDPGNCSALVTYTATAIGTPTPTYSYVFTGANPPSPSSGSGTGSGSTFNLGVTTVAITATNGVTPDDICEFTVTVYDNQPPVISDCPANIPSGTDDGECSAVVTWTEPTADDNCDGAVPYASRSHEPGSVFNTGTTTVTYTFQDNIGNTSTCTFDVIVTDDEAPVISGCPTDIDTGTDGGLCTATVSWTEPTADDNCDGPVSIFSQSHLPPSIFGTGTTTVTYTFKDVQGNISTCTFDVTVTDDEDPSIATCPGNISVGTTDGECGAVVTYDTPTFDDNCDGNDLTGTMAEGLASGSLFPVGTTTVSYAYTDIAGNGPVTCTFSVTVTDDEAPEVSCSNYEREANTAACTYTVDDDEFDAVASDNCSFTLINDYNGTNTLAGEVLTTGVHTIVWTVTDDETLSDVCTSTITINDNTLEVYNVTGGGTYCTGGAGLPVGLDDSETDVEYQLSLDDSPIGLPVTGTGGAISFGNQTATGTYTVEATSTVTGCDPVAMNGSISLSTYPLPTANLSGGGKACFGAATDLSVYFTGATPWDITYTDGINPAVTINDITDNPYTLTVYPEANATYSIISVTDDNGCTNSGTGSVDIYIGPVTTAPTMSACIGTIIDVPITVTNFEKVGAISLTLNYDKTVMTYFDTIDNSGLVDYFYADESGTEGRIRIAGTPQGTAGNLPDGSTLMTIRFNFLGGTTSLEWNDSHPDDTWCEYGDDAEETEPYCDDPYYEYYIDGEVTAYPLTTGTAAVTVPIVCHGGTGEVTITATSGTPPFTYHLGIESNYTGVFTVYAGTYSWSITDNNGCSSVSELIEIIEPAAIPVTGYVKYYNTANTPVSSALISLDQEGFPVYYTNTDVNGYYSFGNVCPGSYNVVITKVLPVVSINATDAGLVNEWGVSPYPIERVKFFAGDVVGNGFAPNNIINSTDAFRIQQYFVSNGTIPFERYPWSFWKEGQLISANPPFPIYTIYVPTITVSSPSIAVDYWGMITGDFNGSAAPTYKSYDATVELIDGETFLSGVNQTLELPIRTVTDIEVGAVSLILNFPSDLVEVTDVIMNNAGGMFNWAVTGNELRIAWNSRVPIMLGAGTELVTMHLKTTSEFTQGETIKFSLADNFLNELADASFNVIPWAILSMDVIESSTYGINEKPVSDQLMLSNYPNPFAESTTLTYVLPFDGHVTIEVNDLFGRRLAVLLDKWQTGRDYSLNVDTRIFDPGMYTLTLRLDTKDKDLVKTIKIVRNW